MAVATVTYSPGINASNVVRGKYVCDGTPSATKIYCGFVPSKVIVTSATDMDVSLTWTSDMAAASGITDAGAAVSSGGITSVDDGTGMGFQVGTDASCQEASKTYSWEAYR